MFLLPPLEELFSPRLVVDHHSSEKRKYQEHIFPYSEYVLKECTTMIFLWRDKYYISLIIIIIIHPIIIEYVTSYLLQLIIIVIALIARHRLEKKKEREEKNLSGKFDRHRFSCQRSNRPSSFSRVPTTIPIGFAWKIQRAEESLSLSLSKFPRGINSCD